MRLAPAQVAARGGSRRFEQRTWQGADHGPALGDARKPVQDRIGYDSAITDAQEGTVLVDAGSFLKKG